MGSLEWYRAIKFDTGIGLKGDCSDLVEACALPSAIWVILVFDTLSLMFSDPRLVIYLLIYPYLMKSNIVYSSPTALKNIHVGNGVWVWVNIGKLILLETTFIVSAFKIQLLSDL